MDTWRCGLCGCWRCGCDGEVGLDVALGFDVAELLFLRDWRCEVFCPTGIAVVV